MTRRLLSTTSGRARSTFTLLALVTLVAAPSCVVPPRPVPAVPAPTTSPTTVPGPAGPAFLALGDTGSMDAAQQRVASAMTSFASSHRADALVLAGDNVYYDGSPSSFPQALDAPYATITSTTPMWVTLGNHDVQAGHGPAQLAHLGLPALPYARTLSRGGVSVQVLFLDSNVTLGSQAAWLDAQLASSTTTWQVVVLHHPVWSCSTHGTTAAVVTTLLPVLRARDVDLVVSGHDHLYQRFSDAGNAVVVTGGGGKALYPATSCPAGTPSPSRSLQRFHFLYVQASPTALDVDVVADDRSVLETFRTL